MKNSIPKTVYFCFKGIWHIFSCNFLAIFLDIKLEVAPESTKMFTTTSPTAAEMVGIIGVLWRFSNWSDLFGSATAQNSVKGKILL